MITQEEAINIATEHLLIACSLHKDPDDKLLQKVISPEEAKEEIEFLVRKDRVRSFVKFGIPLLKDRIKSCLEEKD